MGHNFVSLLFLGFLASFGNVSVSLKFQFNHPILIFFRPKMGIVLCLDNAGLISQIARFLIAQQMRRRNLHNQFQMKKGLELCKIAALYFSADSLVSTH